MGTFRIESSWEIELGWTSLLLLLASIVTGVVGRNFVLVWIVAASALLFQFFFFCKPRNKQDEEKRE